MDCFVASLLAMTAETANPARSDVTPGDIQHSLHATLMVASAALCPRLCLQPCDSPPSTTAAPCPPRSGNCPLLAAPSRHQAVASPASAADAAASGRVQAAL